MKITMFFVTIFSLFLVSCGSSLDDYYPLKPGMKWEYSMETPSGSSKFSIESGPQKKIKRLDVTPQTVVTKDITVTYYFCKQYNGIFRVAKEVGNTLSIEAMPRCLIKIPIQVEASWQTTEPSFVATHTIESLTDTVSVPAGDYSGCLKIKSVATFTQNKISHKLENYTWYAMDIGMVKSIRTTTSKDKSNKTTIELATFNQS